MAIGLFENATLPHIHPHICGLAEKKLKIFSEKSTEVPENHIYVKLNSHKCSNKIKNLKM